MLLSPSQLQGHNVLEASGDQVADPEAVDDLVENSDVQLDNIE